MCGSNLNDFKKAFDNNINNTKDKNKTDSGGEDRSDQTQSVHCACCTVCSQHHRTSCLL